MNQVSPWGLWDEGIEPKMVSLSNCFWKFTSYRGKLEAGADSRWWGFLQVHQLLPWPKAKLWRRQSLSMETSTLTYEFPFLFFTCFLMFLWLCNKHLPRTQIPPPLSWASVKTLPSQRMIDFWVSLQRINAINTELFCMRNSLMIFCFLQCDY